MQAQKWGVLIIRSKPLTDEQLVALRDKFFREGGDALPPKPVVNHLPLLAVLLGLVLWVGIGALVWWWKG